MRIKHLIALVLACALVAGTLAGCGGGTAKAMGRYAEQPLDLPGDVSRVLYAAMDGSGALVYYAQASGGAVLRCVQPTHVQSTAATREPVPWLEDGLTVSSLSVAANGTVYAIASGEEGGSKLYCSKDGQTAQVIETPDWSQGGGFTTIRTEGGRTITGGQRIEGGPTPPGGEGGPTGPGGEGGQGGQRQPMEPGMQMAQGRNPQSVAALDDGFVISYIQGSVIQYDAAGKEVRKLTEGGGMGNMGGMARLGGGGGALAVFGNSIALSDIAAQEVSLYDLTTGQKKDTKRFDGLDGSTYIGLDNDGLLLGDAGGVYRWADDAWKLAVDGGMTSLVMPTLSIVSLIAGTLEDYYAFLSGSDLTGGGTRLVRFRFDESLPAEPDTTLEVFSLNDSDTVRLAIGEFQRQNPNVRVHLQVGIENDSDSATAEEVVRALNTSLLAQKGPDILILDGLPIQSYIEKKVLKDMTAFTETLSKSENLMRNLTGAYEKGGKIYGLPALFGFPAMVGQKDALAKLTSLHALAQTVENWPAQSATPVPILRAPDNLYDENTGMLMDYYESGVSSFTNANGSLNEAALADYLADMLMLSDALKAATPEATDQRRMGRAVAMFATNGRQFVSMDPRAIMEVAQGEALACVQQVTSLGSLMMLFMQLGEVEGMELRSLFGQNQFTPRCGAGIVSASKQQDLAEKFIATLLSSEVQDSNLFDGFPVNGASLQSTLKELKERSEEMTGRELNDMGFVALCESLTTPLFTDETVKAAVAARMKSLLDGSATPEQAAAKIAADTKLYLAE